MPVGAIADYGLQMDDMRRIRQSGVGSFKDASNNECGDYIAAIVV